MIAIDLWVDGANSGPQERGGWAAIIKGPGMTLAISGCEAHTTSNRMELTAVIKGLEAIGHERAVVIIYTDSSYTKNAHTKGWISQWQKNSWVSSRGDAVANRDLWEQMLPLVAKHIVRWKKVKGHSTYVLNNLADEMAVRAKIAQVGETVFL